MKRMLAAIAGSLVGVASAQAPRVPIERTGASVLHPEGWQLMPAAGSPPVAMFSLCDPATTDGCLVRGEMHIGPAPADASDTSLASYLETASARHEGALPPPRRVTSGRYQAAEVFVEAESAHTGRFVMANTLIETPAGFYRCDLIARPDRVDALLDPWRTLCASLNVPDGDTD